MPKRFVATCLRWNDNGGFGFLKPEDGGPDVFVHRSELPNGQDRDTRLEEGDEVEYQEGECFYCCCICLVFLCLFDGFIWVWGAMGMPEAAQIPHGVILTDFAIVRFMAIS